jgi:ABC-type uncharacterized transport system permease subunit
MGRIIRFGGISVVIAVFGMLIFLVSQVFPLFTKAKVDSLTPVHLNQSVPVAFGEDEYGELPFSCDQKGTITFYKCSDSTISKTWMPDFKALGTSVDEQKITPANISVSAVKTYPRENNILFGLSDGSIREFKVNYKLTFDKNGKRVFEPSIDLQYEGKISNLNEPVLEAWTAKGVEGRLYICRQKHDGKDVISARRLTERKGLGGKAKSVCK